MKPRSSPKFTESFVPLPRESVHTVEIDGEAVLLDEVSQRLHHLNGAGTLVWTCFDGESSIGEIVTDLSVELGAARTVVLADVLGMTRRLADEGLLANVGARHSDPPPEVTPLDEGVLDPRFVAEEPDT